MKRILFLFLSLALLSCSSQDGLKDGFNTSLKIEEIRPNKLTAMTKQNLIHLTQIYHLEPFLYTKSIRISSRGKANAYPTLTLTTIHAEAPELLLAQWLHLESLWWISVHEKSFQDATPSLRKKFSGMSSEQYRNLTASFMEYKALVHILGEKEARRIVAKKKSGHYTIVLGNFKELQRIFKTNKLIPPGP